MTVKLKMTLQELIEELEKLKESCACYSDDEYSAGFFDAINRVMKLIKDETQGN